jgi:hypothetical protein
MQADWWSLEEHVCKLDEVEYITDQGPLDTGRYETESSLGQPARSCYCDVLSTLRLL